MFVVNWTNENGETEAYVTIDRLSADFIAKSFAIRTGNWAYVFETNRLDVNGVGRMTRIVEFGPNGEVR